jgi:hypothetical protein
VSPDQLSTRFDRIQSHPAQPQTRILAIASPIRFGNSNRPGNSNKKPNGDSKSYYDSKKRPFWKRKKLYDKSRKSYDNNKRPCGSIAKPYDSAKKLCSNPTLRPSFLTPHPAAILPSSNPIAAQTHASTLVCASALPWRRLPQ